MSNQSSGSGGRASKTGNRAAPKRGPARSSARSARAPFPGLTPQQESQRLLLSLAATSLQDNARWQTVAALQRKRMGDEKPVALGDVAETLPPELASVDPNRVLRVTVRGLHTVTVGAQLLRHFSATVELAVRRFRQGKSTLTRRQIKRALGLSRHDANVLSEILSAEGNIFLQRSGRVPALFSRRRRWQISERVSLYEGVASVAEYLAVAASCPVLAAARPRPSENTTPAGGRRTLVRAVATEALGHLIGAGLFALLLLGLGYLALR